MYKDQNPVFNEDSKESEDEGWTDDDEDDSDQESDDGQEYENITKLIESAVNPEPSVPCQTNTKNSNFQSENLKFFDKAENTNNYLAENENLLKKILEMQESLNDIRLENYALKAEVSKNGETKNCKKNVKFASSDESSTDFKSEDNSGWIIDIKTGNAGVPSKSNKIDIKINGINIMKCLQNNAIDQNGPSFTRPGQSRELDYNNIKIDIRNYETGNCKICQDSENKEYSSRTKDKYRKELRGGDKINYTTTNGRHNASKCTSNKVHKPSNKSSSEGTKADHKSSHSSKSRAHAKITKTHSSGTGHKTEHVKPRKRNASKHKSRK